MCAVISNPSSFEKKESDALGVTTVLQTRVHPSQQKFFDLLCELKFRAIFLVALGVMYHDRFFSRNERNLRFDCSFLSVGLPADFLDWAGR